MLGFKKFTAFGGIRNRLSPERLALATKQVGGIDQRTDLVEAVNVDIDDSGRVSRRAGQTVKVAGASHSIWAEDDMCLFGQGGSLLRMFSDYSTKVLATGLSGDALHYLAVNGNVYWTNGTQTGVIIAGINQPWGLAAPAYPPTATATSGSLRAGTYLFTMAYLHADGRESGAGLAGRIDLPDNSGIAFGWSGSIDPALSRAIYLSEPNGEVMYRAMLATGTSAIYGGGALALPLNTQWLDMPPAGQDLAYHRGRIYIAQGAHLFATGAHGYNYCDLRDYIALDGSAISFVLGVTHGLYVATERAVYFLAGDNLADMTANSVVDSYGVVGSDIIVDGFAATGDERLAGSQCALFATGLGVCMGTPDGTVTNLTFDRFHSRMPRSGAAVLRVSDQLTQYLLAMRE